MLVLLTALGLLAVPGAHGEVDADKQMLLGNPDQASSNPGNREHLLIRRPQYALSYNDRLHYPNWVSWKLDGQDLGNQPRSPFAPDTQLPQGFRQITPGDYTRSGYDRGHNCPSGDRTASPQDNAAVFLMSNMTPQAHGLNAGPWEQLESECRSLARAGNSLYIVAGHGFSAPTHNTIGRAQIAVPDFAWKVVVVAPRGRPIDASARVIAVRMPNVNTIAKRGWREFITTPAQIEKATGLTFFNALDSQVAAALRARQDGGKGTDTPQRAHTGQPPGRQTTPTPAGTLSVEEAARQGLVWVNLSSGKYWRPGTRYYGQTKRGRFLSESAAQAAGYKPAGGQ